jgi:hypothetical protein
MTHEGEDAMTRTKHLMAKMKASKLSAVFSAWKVCLLSVSFVHSARSGLSCLRSRCLSQQDLQEFEHSIEIIQHVVGPVAVSPYH